MHHLGTKRTYAPKARGDGHRVLVERLWPRGQTHEEVAAEAWLKDVAPSTELRRWFGHEPARWEGFKERYRQELQSNPEAWRPLLERVRHHPVTLLYSAKDEHHNSALVLKAFLEEQLAHDADAGAGAAP